jgi:hypothetical protein
MQIAARVKLAEFNIRGGLSVRKKVCAKFMKVLTLAMFVSFRKYTAPFRLALLLCRASASRYHHPFY